MFAVAFSLDEFRILPLQTPSKIQLDLLYHLLHIILIIRNKVIYFKIQKLKNYENYPLDDHMDHVQKAVQSRRATLR